VLDEAIAVGVGGQQKERLLFFVGDDVVDFVLQPGAIARRQVFHRRRQQRPGKDEKKKDRTRASTKGHELTFSPALHGAL
jgi:hypothetical protein